MDALSLPALTRARVLRCAASGVAAGLVGMPWSAALARVSAAPGFPAMNPDIAGEKAVLDVWLSLDLAGEPAYHAAIDAFQRTYRGLTVRLTPVVFADVPDKLKIAAQGGRVPDLVSHHAYLLRQLRRHAGGGLGPACDHAGHRDRAAALADPGCGGD